MISAPRRKPFSNRLERRETPRVSRLYPFLDGSEKRGLILGGNLVGENRLVHEFHTTGKRTKVKAMPRRQ